MLLPETKGIALPETVDDVEKLGRCVGRPHAPSPGKAVSDPGEQVC